MSSNDEKNGNTTDAIPDLRKFVGEQLLSNNTRGKTISILGKFPSVSADDKAIVILEKKAFTEEQVLGATKQVTGEGDVAAETKTIFAFVNSLDKEFVNDIYGNFTLSLDPSVNTVKTTIIYPATQLHIQKYSQHALYIVQETPERFKNITEPYLDRKQFSLDVSIAEGTHYHPLTTLIFILVGVEYFGAQARNRADCVRRSRRCKWFYSAP